MRTYIIRRLLLMLPTIYLASLIIFIIMRLIPGTTVDLIMAELRMETEEARAAIECELGLDVPILTQYGRWMGVLPQADGSLRGLFQGDLGVSTWKKIPVIEEIAMRWSVTFELGFLALIIAQLIALPVGIYSAIRQDTWGDYIARSYAILCISVPGFWVATMVIVLPSIWWGYMPSISLIPFIEDPLGNLKMFIVPAIVLGMGMGGMTMRMTRTMMLEVLRQDYIRTAWSKGLKERIVLLRHALRNALIPIVTIIGFQVPVLVGGTVIMEEIFQLPGMGRLMLFATTQRDYPLVSGIMLIFACVLVLTNLMVDLTYAYLDPRVHYK